MEFQMDLIHTFCCFITKNVSIYNTNTGNGYNTKSIILTKLRNLTNDNASIVALCFSISTLTSLL